MRWSSYPAGGDFTVWYRVWKQGGAPSPQPADWNWAQLATVGSSESSYSFARYPSDSSLNVRVKVTNSQVPRAAAPLVDMAPAEWQACEHTGSPPVSGGDPAHGADPAGDGCYYGPIQSGWAGTGPGWTDPPEHRGPRVMISWTWDSDPDGDGTQAAATGFEIQGGNTDANGWQADYDLTAQASQAVKTGEAWMWPATWSGPNADHTDIRVRAVNGTTPAGAWSDRFQALCRLGVD